MDEAHASPAASQTPEARSPARQRRTFSQLAATALTIAAWLYLFTLAAIATVIWLAGDRWWFATFILFGPRWLYAVPLVALVPLGLALNRRLWRPLLAAALVMIGPILGFNLPFARLWPPGGPTLRVMTCKVGGPQFDVAALADTVARENPDLIALQECFSPRPLAALQGYHVVRRGELVVASRWPVTAEPPFPGADAAPRLHRDLLLATIDTPHGPLTFGSVHLPSPRHGLVEVVDRRWLVQPSRAGRLIADTAQRREHTEAIAGRAAGQPSPTVLAGDFNTPVESTTYREFWSGWNNAFSQTGFGLGGTMRAAVRGLRFSIRIDHVLCGPELRPRRAWVGPDVGSEHLPLVADLAWPDADD